MDRRVKRTKKAMHSAFVEMIKENNVAAISVTDLCKKAKVSRVTFYAYYKDKYDLLEAVLVEFEKRNLEIFDELEEANNPGKDFKKAIENMLEAVLSTSNNLFVPQGGNLENTDWIYAFYRYVNRNLRHLEERYNLAGINDEYLETINAFAIIGGTGALLVGNVRGYDEEKSMSYVREILSTMIDPDQFKAKSKEKEKE